MKIRRLVIGIILLMVLAIGVYAAIVMKNEASVTNNLSVGSVAIRLAVYEKTDTGEKPIQDGGVVSPNQTVSYIPRITSQRADCYVRVSMRVIMDQQIENAISPDDVVDLNEDWVRKGDVFYCKKPLHVDEESDVFSGIHIPSSWTDKNASGFRIKLVADAVQAEHVQPNFRSEQPWGSIKIEEAKEEDDTLYRNAESVPSANHLKYDGNQIYEISSSDFFQGMKTLVPGDLFKNKIEVRNGSKNDIQLQMAAKAKNSKLLEQVQLKIWAGKDLFYDGPLMAEKLGTFTNIMNVPRYEIKYLTFSVTMPEWLQNDYSVLKDAVTWKFRAIEVDSQGNPVQTGDHDLWLFYVALGAAGYVLLLLIFTRIKERSTK